MVGSLHGARMALCDNLEVIGEGSFRVVYRQGDVVYKVEHSEGIEAKANIHEVIAVDNLSDLPDNVAVPEYELYNVDGIHVLASQFIDGILMGDCEGIHLSKEECGPACLSNELVNALYTSFDLAYGNVIFDGTTYWIVDVD